LARRVRRIEGKWGGEASCVLGIGERRWRVVKDK
jgi:hypothetical protein